MLNGGTKSVVMDYVLYPTANTLIRYARNTHRPSNELNVNTLHIEGGPSATASKAAICQVGFTTWKPHTEHAAISTPRL
jgi:hypothetical protein